MVLCFTKYLLEKKGALSRIWLAAHWEAKLKRSYIFEIDIEQSINDMITAEIILDLRISGHLLIGIVKIYSKKAQFLLNECNNVFYVVSTFRACGIDLPDNKKEACMKEITLPENFEDLNISDNSDLITMLSTNQSCVEKITLKENFESLTNINDEIEGLVFEDDTGLDLIEDLHSLTKYNKGPSVEHFELQNDENGHLENNEDIIQQNDEDNTLQSDEYLADNSLMDSDSSDLISCKNQLKKSDIIKDCLTLEPLKRAREKKLKRKRKLIIDPVTYISYEKIQKQIFESSDLVEVVNFMPGTKRLMHLKQIGTAEQLFRLPNINMGNDILHLYQRNLISHKRPEFMENSEEEEEETFRKCVNLKSNGSKCSVLCKSIQLDDDMDSTLELDTNGYDISTSLEVQYNRSDPLMNEGGEMHLETYHEVFHSPEEENPSKLTARPEQDDFSPFEPNEVSDHWKDILGNRLIELYHSLQHNFYDRENIEFSFLVKNKTKLKVAQTFFSLLMLKKLQIVDIHQSEPYEEIFIYSGENFNEA